MDREQQKAGNGISTTGDSTRRVSLNQKPASAVSTDGASGENVASAKVSDFTSGTWQESVSQRTASPEREGSTSQRLVPAGQWMREVLGLHAPFGHDGLPTVWG